MVPPCFRNALDLSHFDAIDLFIVIIALLILFIRNRFAVTGCCKGCPFPFVSPDTQTSCSPTVCLGAKQYSTYASKSD
jgi:hypothetical protein